MNIFGIIDAYYTAAPPMGDIKDISNSPAFTILNELGTEVELLPLSPSPLLKKKQHLA
jgi:hypothetical protein